MSNTDILTLTAVDVSNSVYDYVLLESVRGCLEGVTDDYYFFQYDSDDFCLIISDDCHYDADSSYFTASSGHVIQFRRAVRDLSYNTSLPVSGSNGGQFAGFENAGTYNGTFSGTITDRVRNSETYYYCMQYDASDIVVRNSNNYLVYGSFEGLPHLIEGVQNYAYLAVHLFVGVVVYRILARIFRRLY